MNRREKILAIVLLSAVGLWGARSLISDVLLAPINNRNAEITALQSQIDKQNDHVNTILAATRKLAKLKQQSLPPDHYEAAALYKNWLLEQAEQAEFKNIHVARTRIVPTKETYAIIGMTVTAQGTLKQVADYLFAIQRADLLQKVRKVDLQSDKHEGEPALEVMIVIDALAINDATPRETLFEKGRAEAVSELMDGKTREQYALITDRNPFVRGYNGPPPPKVVEKPPEKDPEPVKPGIDAAEHVYLVGTVAKGDQWDALLYDRTTNSRTSLLEGKGFEVAGIKGTVLKIGSDFLTLQIDDVVWRLELGQNLRQIEKVEAAEAKPETPTTASVE
ncbi:hypothetical protein [Symmachiella dynata]|uniref:hypothetical protein n=1 Tax=Symmachiella dynata TaxID=2527995 RepID=UPI0030EB2AD1